MSKKFFIFWLTLFLILSFTFSQSLDSFADLQFDYKNLSPILDSIQDLTINSVSFKPEVPEQGDEIEIIVEIENTNSSIAYSEINLEVRLNDEVIGRKSIPSLEPEEKIEVTISYDLPESLTGGVTFQVILNPPDGSQKLASVNISSKIKLITPYVAEPISEPKLILKLVKGVIYLPKEEGEEGKSDLTITDVSFRPADPSTTDQIFIDIEIKNQGDGSAIFPPGATIWSATRPQGDGIGERLPLEQGMSIAPDETYEGTVTFVKPGELKADTYTIEAKVDPDNQIEESEEENNESIYYLTIWEESMADLSIESIYPRQHIQLVEGEYQCIYVLVRNSGDVSPKRVYPNTSPDSIRIILYYKKEGETDWKLFEEPRRGFINVRSGEAVGFSFSRDALFALPAGGYLFRGLVDEWAVLRDRNFQDNVLKEEISIAPSPILVKSFSPFRTAWGAKILLEISTGRDLLDPAHPVSLSVRFGEVKGVVENILKRAHPDYTLTVVVTEGATSGPVSVSADGVTGTSQSSLTIFGPPTITDISPQACPVGDIITIRGTDFVPSTMGDGTAVEFVSSGTAEGKREVDVLPGKMSQTEIQVKVPSDALSGPLTVKTVAGGQLFSVTSETPFRVLPKINYASPNRGHIGDSIKLYGTSFGLSPQVEFNGLQAEVIGPIPNRPLGEGVEVRVPEGATAGRIRVITDEGSAESEEDFRVLTGPTINSISPQNGPEGTLVTIEGEDLDLITSTSLSISGRRTWGLPPEAEIVGTPTENRAQLRIPTGINSPGIVEVSVYFPVHWSNKVPFELTAEGMTLRTPQIESIRPPRSVPGATVILNVKYLPNPQPEIVTVAFNGVPGETKEIIDRGGDVYEVYTRIPEGATTGPITVTTYNVTGTTVNNFPIFGPPTITEISPPSKRVGGYITIRGTNFVPSSGGDSTLVYFNTATGGSREVAPAAYLGETEFRVRVPPEAVTGPLTITTLIAGRSYSTTSEIEFVVEED